MGFSLNMFAGFIFIAYGSCTNIRIISTGDGKMHKTHDYGVNVKNRSGMLFRVKGCHDGYIGLFEGPDFSTSDRALILIGGWRNNKCKLQPCKDCSDSFSKSHQYLNCNEMRPMWVNWTGRLLSVGEGVYVGERTFMYTKQLRDFDVQYFAVSSTYNQVFYWEFDGYPGNYFERVMPYGWSTRQMLSSMTASSVVNCIIRCHSSISCKSVSYQSTTNTCQLHFERPRSVDIHRDNTWDTWMDINE